MSDFEPDAPDRITTERPRELAGIEQDAARLAEVIERYALLDLPESPVAERHAQRLRFALARLCETRRESPAATRAEIALWILETHVENAAAFVNRLLREARRRPGRRTMHAEVDEAATLMERRLSAA
jgi:hypothetical protein